METTKKNLDLTTYKFPDVTGLDVAFPTAKTERALLEEAKFRGFYNSFNNPYCRLFSEIFFGGGTVKFKPGLDPAFKTRAYAYFRSFIGSWEPKHEDKQAICAMLLSELVEPELEKSATK